MKYWFSLLLLATSILLSTVCAQVADSGQVFEVASIKRNLSGRHWFWGPPRGGRWVATNASVKRLVSLAWKTPSFAISGGPPWVAAEEYDISAKEPDASTTDEEFLEMLRNLLIERFALEVHTETHVMPVYLLVPARGGQKLPEAAPEPCLTFALKSGTSASPESQSPCGGMNVTPGLVSNDRISMAWFTGVLEALVGRPVLNRTGFSGSFKLRLEFDPLNPSESDGMRPSIFSALQEQLGLRLETGRDRAEILVIDHAERPTGN